MSDKNLIPKNNQWTFEFIQKITDILGEIFASEFPDLDIYPNRIEIVSSDQMLDAYSTHGMPIYYNHWKIGKDYLINKSNYKKGYQGLAYEIVTNTNECISYNMEDNTATMTALVIAHAAYGHNAFFANNYLFSQYTDAKSIVDYLAFSHDFIKKCEEKYGEDTVEEFLDACHSIQWWGIDKYVRRHKSKKDKENYIKNLLKEDQYNYNYVLDRSSVKQKNVDSEIDKFPKENEENILYFLEKYAPKLETWQREILRIVRKTSTYFYPNFLTKTINEGTATFVHYHLLNKLFDLGYVDEGFMLEFLTSHTSVVHQPDFDSKYFSGFNPYALGFAILQDVKRICENPTDEDLEWFPDICNTDWKKTFTYIVKNYKDETFILQFLSPKVIRDFRLFYLIDDTSDKNLKVKRIHDDRGYKDIRKILASKYNWISMFPEIEVESVDLHGDRTLNLVYNSYNGFGLNKSSADKTLSYIKKIWGYDVKLKNI